MSDYDNNNRGAVWRNEKKATDRHPDFTGKATIDGVDYYVSAWKRGPDDNPKAPALRFSVTPVAEVAKQGMDQARQAAQPRTQPIPDAFDEDDIPF
jgi:hypothetical protein